MSDPRRPRSNEAQLPDALDQTAPDAPPDEAEAHGSEDAQLVEDGSDEGDV